MTAKKKETSQTIRLKEMIDELMHATEDAQSEMDCGVDPRMLVAAETKRDALRLKIMNILDEMK